ncbi:hypothetical protein NDU88_001686 [Pleurodeles waltl]|uniref:Uncharacterized protein n=1 Tax=Pleurodeles waltl TaxID=8319 RepID=A0AAV7TJ18_PLEWA|nr:hypothetical protein NDU88_001686 [Pleurodeles waltl]
MAPWRGPETDLLPPGAAAGLKSARPLCALRSSTHSRTPQKPPRLPLSFARTASAVSRPARVLLPLLRPLRCS